MPIEHLINKIVEEALSEARKAKEEAVKKKCTTCRYGKTCDPKKGVEGFQFQTKSTPFDPKKEFTNFRLAVGFECSKRKPRKKPIAWEETSVYKKAHGG